MKGYSFCISTDGKEPEKTGREIGSILSLHVFPESNFEIILCGNNVPVMDYPHGGLSIMRLIELGILRFVPAITLAQNGNLGAMRNLVCDRAYYNTIILADDDILFDHDFAWGLEHCEYGDDWDVMAVRIQNPDGSRYWDWKTHQDGRDQLLDYSVKWHPALSLTGGIMVLRKSVRERVRWNNELGFYQGEDVEFTEMLKTVGLRIRLNLRCLVTHMADYTQSGDVVVRK